MLLLEKPFTSEAANNTHTHASPGLWTEEQRSMHNSVFVPSFHYILYKQIILYGILPSFFLLPFSTSKTRFCT